MSVANNRNFEQELASYKSEIAQLESQVQEYEKQVIIQDERIRQLKEQLEKEYGTSEEEKLIEIKKTLENEITELQSVLGSPELNR
jgi:hypothetical protein